MNVTLSNLAAITGMVLGTAGFVMSWMNYLRDRPQVRPTPLRKGGWPLPPSPHFVFPIYFPALFADACTLAGGAYFLQSGFEQRSCSTHEQATRLSPFQKSQGVSSVQPTASASAFFADSLILSR